MTEQRTEAPIELKSLLEYATVRTWIEGLQRHWGGDPVSDDPERLPMLEAFCRHFNRDPDQIISETTLLKDGERRIRVKGRARYAVLIAEWQAQQEGSRIRKAKWGNAVRSFLIHNGVMLQSGIQA
jgi:hypothetical protein